MMRAVLLLLVAVLAGCATYAPLPPPPSVEQVVQMSKDKVPDEEIIGRMRDARAVYRLSASELARLREQGVSDKVVDYMQQTYINAERFDEYLRTRDQYMWYGWPGYRGYPYAPYWRSPYFPSPYWW